LRLAVALLVLLGGAALAQDIGSERAALERTQRAARSAAERATRLESAANAANDEAAKLRASATAVAARIQSAEADIDAAEARIAVVEQLRAAQRARLAEKQVPTVRLVAALQTMARRPPALALLQPGSIRDIVHVHAVLASVLPVVRARTADLRADVERGRQLRAAADSALAAEHGAQARLVVQRQQLVALEARKRIESSRFASGAMAEQDRAIAMGEEARDITDLMGRIDDATFVRARLESLPGPILRPAQPLAARALPNDAPVPTAAIPAYRLPVVGQVVTGLGEVSDAGVRARGLTIATRAGAQVVAPTSGRIVFAGPFRGYGNIVVIDHGLGWTTLLTSLAALDVKAGDTVDQGAPIGRAGPDRPTVTVELRRRGTPVDIAKLAG
jgi:septal ring factor EnvC (AmiA/AmiB activator)